MLSPTMITTLVNTWLDSFPCQPWNTDVTLKAPSMTSSHINALVHMPTLLWNKAL